MSILCINLHFRYIFINCLRLIRKLISSIFIFFNISVNISIFDLRLKCLYLFMFLFLFYYYVSLNGLIQHVWFYLLFSLFIIIVLLFKLYFLCLYKLICYLFRCCYFIYLNTKIFYLLFVVLILD